MISQGQKGTNFVVFTSRNINRRLREERGNMRSTIFLNISPLIFFPIGQRKNFLNGLPHPIQKLKVCYSRKTAPYFKGIAGEIDTLFLSWMSIYVLSCNLYVLSPNIL